MTDPFQVAWTKLAGNVDKTCCTLNLYGMTDSGRTSLAFTLPGPFALFHEFEKVEVLHELVATQGLDIRPYCFGRDFMSVPNYRDRRDVALNVIREMKAYWLDAIANVKTIVVDTEHALYRCVQMSQFGTWTLQYDEYGRPLPKGTENPYTGKRGQLHWQTVNGFMWSFIHAVKEAQQVNKDRPNLVFISKAEEERVGKERTATGRVIRSGWKHLDNPCDVRIKTTLMESNGILKAEVMKGWYGRRGLIYQDQANAPVGGRTIHLPSILADVLSPNPDRNSMEWMTKYTEWMTGF